MMNRRNLGRMAATLAVACSMVPWSAMAADEAPDALIKRLSTDVLETVRGSGVAAALVEAAVHAAVGMGVGLLWLGTHKDNKRAQKAYRRSGFVKVGRRTYDVGGHRCTDVVLSRLL